MISALSREGSSPRELDGSPLVERLLSVDEQRDAEIGSMLLQTHLVQKESFFGSFSQIEDAVHLHLQEDSYSSVTRVIRYVYSILASAAMIVAVRLWGEMTPGTHTHTISRCDEEQAR